MNPKPRCVSLGAALLSVTVQFLWPTANAIAACPPWQHAVARAGTAKNHYRQAFALPNYTRAYKQRTRNSSNYSKAYADIRFIECPQRHSFCDKELIKGTILGGAEAGAYWAYGSAGALGAGDPARNCFNPFSSAVASGVPFDEFLVREPDITSGNLGGEVEISNGSLSVVIDPQSRLEVTPSPDLIPGQLPGSLVEVWIVDEATDSLLSTGIVELAVQRDSEGAVGPVLIASGLLSNGTFSVTTAGETFVVFLKNGLEEALNGLPMNGKLVQINVRGRSRSEIEEVPTVSEWGLGGLAVLLLSGVALKFGRRRAVTA